MGYKTKPEIIQFYLAPAGHLTSSSQPRANGRGKCQIETQSSAQRILVVSGRLLDNCILMFTSELFRWKRAEHIHDCGQRPNIAYISRMSQDDGRTMMYEREAAQVHGKLHAMWARERQQARILVLWKYLQRVSLEKVKTSSCAAHISIQWGGERGGRCDDIWSCSCQASLTHSHASEIRNPESISCMPKTAALTMRCDDEKKQKHRN